MPVVSISLPEPLLEEADALLKREGFAGRSELARAALRDFIAAHDEDAGLEQRTATLTLVYAHGHERVFSTIRHHHLDVVRTALHGHSGERCVELFVLEGPAERIRSFAGALRATREALRVSLTYTDLSHDRPTAPPHRHRHERPG